MNKIITTIAVSALLTLAHANPYEKCKGCHGQAGEKVALGKSAKITGQDAERTVKQLTAYKNGTLNLYGMGAIMKAQVRSMTDEDIKAMADYISELKTE